MGRKSPLMAVIFSCGVLLWAVVGLASCGSQTAIEPSTQRSTDSSTITSVSVVTADVPAVGQKTTSGTKPTITSSTEPIEPPILARPFTRLLSDMDQAGIQVFHAENSGGQGNVPGLLFLEALTENGQDVTAYQGMAEEMLTLAEKYKQELYFDRLRMALVVAQEGEVLYDHTFEAAPPSSTTSTTLPFLIRYSAPRLEVTPRAGVTLRADVSYYWGTVVLDVEITNDSSSAFHFPQEDLQLYVNNVRVEPTQEDAGWPTEFAAGSGGSSSIYLTVPQFDPYAAGLLYIASDSQSQGFTARDGLTP